MTGAILGLLGVAVILAIVWLASYAIQQIRAAQSESMKVSSEAIGDAMAEVMRAMYPSQPAPDLDAEAARIVDRMEKLGAGALDVPDWANANIDPTDAAFPTEGYQSSFVVPEGMDPLAYLTGLPPDELAEHFADGDVAPPEELGGSLAGEFT